MSLQIYYTGAANKDDLSNTSSSKSLGGLVATSSLVPNGRLNSIFGSVSKVPSLGLYSEYRAIAVKNNTGGALTNVEIYLTQPTGTPQASFELAVVTVVEDVNCPGVYSMEEVSDSHSQPFTGTFTAPDIITPGVIASWPDGAYYGIWIKRTINPELVKSGTSCATLVSDYDTNLSPSENTLSIDPTLEQFELVLDY